MHFFSTPERGQQFIVVGKGWQGTLTVHGYQQADSGLPKAPSWSCAREQRELSGPRTGRWAAEASSTHQPAWPLSFHSPHSALPFHPQPRAWWDTLTRHPYAQTLQQKGLSSFNKDPLCRMILEKQGFASRGKAGSCRAYSAPEEDGQDLLVFPTGWGWVPETAQREGDGERAARAVSGLPTQSGCREHLLQKSVHWSRFLVGIGFV